MFGRKITAGLMTGGAAVAMMMAFSAPAAAQGSEVEMLRSQVQDLLARIEKLEQTPAPTVSAPAATIAPGNSKIKVTLGGWINRAMTYADDGVDDDILFVDNNGASSRINISASGKITDQLSAGSVFELEAVSQDSRGWGIEGVGASQGGASSAFRFQERKMEVWFEANGVGRLWLGQGDTASNVIAEVDLSKTANMGLYSDIGATFGGILFRNEATEAAGRSINSAFSNFDGLSRDDRIRFDTTSFGGFSLSAGATETGNLDFAARYAGKLGETSVSGAIGYVDFDGGAAEDLIAGSVSALLANGLNVTFAAGTRDNTTRDDSTYWYGKIGYVAKLTTIGETAFSVDYYDGSDIAATNADANAWGLSLVQYLDAISSQVYVSFRSHSYEEGTADFEDVNALMTGARVRF